MPQPATTSLFQAATSTFESLALLFPERCSVEGAEFIPLASTVNVTFRGASYGRLVIGVTAGVLPALVENMLGIGLAPEMQLQLQRDALGELANVVTGNVLPMIYGATAVYRLDAPAPAGPQPFRALDGETALGVTRLQMQEGEALLALFSADVAPEVRAVSAFAVVGA